MADNTETQEAEAPESAAPWHGRLKAYREAIEDKWSDQRRNIDKMYSRDDRADAADREYAIFWANIEVLKAASYARTPVPVVAPRFKQSNQIASVASDVIERTLITTFEQSDVDGCLREIRDEFLRYGRGTAWVRLAVDDKSGEKVKFDFITADDFAHDPKRSWREVDWVAYRAWLSRDEGRERFDKPLKAYGKSFDDVPLKKKDDKSIVTKSDDQAPVWEIWDRKGGRVLWVNEETDCILDQQPPYLDLSGFWPCPRPAFGTVVPKKLKPVPDIRQYKDQIEEINEYTARIAAISEQLRLKGFYPAGAGELSEAIEVALKSLDNRATLIPVSSYAALGNASFKDSIVWLPITDALVLVKGLVELRRIVIDDVYQITGISDIVRGQTDPNETKGAQVLKSQWGSIRIRDRQNELARVARDMTRIAGEIVAENFSQQTLMAMSQVQLPSAQDKAQAQAQIQQQQQPPMPGQPQQPQQPPPPEIVEMLKKPSFEEVIAFLRDDRTRGFSIEIETDSTIQPDEDAEKQRRTEFVTAIGGLLKDALPIVQAAPQIGEFIGEVLKFTAQGFRAGRPLEGAIDKFTQMLAQMGQQQQQGNPAAAAKAKEAEAKLQATQATTQATVTKAQASMAQTQMDMQANAQDAQFNAQEHQLNMEELQARAAMNAMNPNPNAPRN